MSALDAVATSTKASKVFCSLGCMSGAVTSGLGLAPPRGFVADDTG